VDDVGKVARRIQGAFEAEAVAIDVMKVTAAPHEHADV